MKKKIIFSLFFVFLCIFSLAAEKAVLENIKGKVEVKTRNGRWNKVVTGMEVNLADTISTGFNSSVTLVMGDNNVLVKPLTRMTIDEYMEKEGKVSTSLFLRVGAVRAKVDDSGKFNQNFQVTSPYSTASVRGTEFNYDGLKLEVIDGKVALVIGPPDRPNQDEEADILIEEEPEDEGDETSGELGEEPTEGEPDEESQPQDEPKELLVETGGTVEMDMMNIQTGGVVNVTTGQQILVEDTTVSTKTGDVTATGGEDEEPSGGDEGGDPPVIIREGNITIEWIGWRD